MNNTDPAIALPEDQCVLMQNAEIVESMLGERRLGTDAITLPAFLSARERVTFLFRHLPLGSEVNAQLWALGITSPSTAKLGYKTTSWTEVTISDTPDVSSNEPYYWAAVTLHGKIHFTYRSDQDRMHVWDGTTMRRAGLAEPAAPTAADAGGAGSLTGVRYGRVRYVEVSGSTVVRRSEPSDALTFTPGGSNASITWTKPAAISEGETHWEIELSIDNATFYRMARIVVATTTHTDSVAYTTGYAATGTLSEDVGDYSLAWSAQYVTADGDRLLFGGGWAYPYTSRIGWTPVTNADGVGNDERMESDTDPTLDLDTDKYGSITGMSEPVLGAIWVTKNRAIYKLTRTGSRTAAYAADLFSSNIGAIHRSLIAGVDELGQPCLYAIDLEQGPYRIGIGGIKRCGEDLRATWREINMTSTGGVASAVYYPAKKQVIWCLATGASNAPDTAIVLHVDKARGFADGVRKGWSVWTGDRAKALTMCLFADNIEAGTARSSNLVPFIGLTGLGLVHLCDTGIDDNGTAYAATITTKPVSMGSLADHFEVRAAALNGKAVSGAAVDVACIRDFGKETTQTVADVSFTPAASETQITTILDSLRGAEMGVGQFSFTDVDSPTAQWQLNRFDVVGEKGQAS
jgi:hypothetical protein